MPFPEPLRITLHPSAIKFLPPSNRRVILVPADADANLEVNILRQYADITPSTYDSSPSLAQKGDFYSYDFVDAVGFKKGGGKFKIVYHMKWTGYSTMTWEPEKNLKLKDRRALWAQYGRFSISKGVPPERRKCKGYRRRQQRAHQFEILDSPTSTGLRPASQTSEATGSLKIPSVSMDDKVTATKSAEPDDAAPTATAPIVSDVSPYNLRAELVRQMESQKCFAPAHAGQSTEPNGRIENGEQTDRSHFEIHHSVGTDETSTPATVSHLRPPLRSADLESKCLAILRKYNTLYQAPTIFPGFPMPVVKK